MRVWQLRLLALVGAGALGIGSLTCGCSEQSNGTPGQVGSTAAGAVAAPQAPQGPFPRGSVDPSRIPDPATVGPDLELVSPERGAQVSAADVLVRVRATDPDGVGAVTIAGQAAASAGGDVYEALVPLGRRGTVLVDVEGTDALGNRATSCFTVVHGDFQARDEFARPVGAQIGPNGLDRLGQVVSVLLAGVDIEDAIKQKNPLLTNAVFELRAASLAHDPAVAELAGEPNGLAVLLSLDQVTLELDVDLFGGPLTRATLTADRADLVFHGRLDPAAPRHLLGDLTIQSVDVAFQNFQLTTTSAILTPILGLFRGTIENVVKGALEDILADAVDDLIGPNGLPGFDAPLPIDLPFLPGAPQLALEFAVDQADGSPLTGVNLGMAVKATASQPAQVTSRDVFVGASTPVPAIAGGDDFVVGISEDAANAFLHAFWDAGAIALTVDGTQPPDPASPFLPNARLLYPFFPVAQDLAPDPDTPLVIEIAAGTPPLARFGAAGNSLEVETGEIELRLLFDYMDGGPREELVTLRLALTVQEDFVVRNDDLVVQNLRATSSCVDVISAAPGFDDQELEDFLDQTTPWLLDRFKGLIPDIPIPALPYGLDLHDPRIEALPGLLVVRGQLR